MVLFTDLKNSDTFRVSSSRASTGYVSRGVWALVIPLGCWAVEALPAS